MNEIYDLIRDFNNDKNVIKLKNYYSSLSFMEILGVDRNEMVHSSFLSWLFNSKINYDLGNKPLILLLDLLIQSDKKNIFIKKDKEAIVLRNVDVKLDYIKSEYPIGDNKKDGRIDIYIQFSINNNQYAVVIENKVESHENEAKEKGVMQTEKYFNYFSKQKNKINYIYVFLAPSFNGKNVIASSKEFINISYSDLVKNIMIPLLSDDNLLDKTRFILDDYLKVLSKPNIVNPNSKSVSMLGLDNIGDEKELIENIRNNHFKLGEQLKLDKENDILNSFQDDTLNKIIITATWPESIKKRTRNRSFLELNINPGTILYLSKTQFGDERDPRGISVKTIDNLNQVEFIDKNGKTKVDVVSNAIRELKEIDYNVGGFNWLIYFDGEKDINLTKIKRK